MNVKKSTLRWKKWAENNKERKKAYNKQWKKDNKERVNVLSKQWQKDNLDKVRSSKLKNRYGITLDEYNRMLEEQKEVCKICDNPPSVKKTLAVDHCHTTKKVRGLLCQHCNTMLGKAKDDVKILEKAINYIKEAL